MAYDEEAFQVLGVLHGEPKFISTKGIARLLFDRADSRVMGFVAHGLDELARRGWLVTLQRWGKRGRREHAVSLEAWDEACSWRLAMKAGGATDIEPASIETR